MEMIPKELISAAFTALECSDGTTEEQVKLAYRQLVKVWHPDRFEADSALKSRATEKMKLLNEAYELLAEIFKEQRRQAALRSVARAPAAVPDAHSKQETPKASESKIGDETVKISVSHDPQTGQVVFDKEIKKVTDFDGRWLSISSQYFTTRPVTDDLDFESASSSSMSFRMETKDATSGRSCSFSLLKEPDGVDGEWAYTYRFSDGSSVTEGGERHDTLFNNPEKRAMHGRSSKSLSDMEEAYCFFKKRDDWRACVEIAQRAVDLHPENSWGWIQRSFALHCLKSTQAALDAIMPAAALFPTDFLVFYCLACYEAQLGNKPAALHWLEKTFVLLRDYGLFSPTYEKYRKMIAEDPDLNPVRDLIPQEPFSWKLRRIVCL